MILYLTSNQNIGLFDFLEKENGYTIRKLNMPVSLRKFVVSDMKSLGHFSHMIIDLQTLTDTDAELVDALVGLQNMYSGTRIILFAEGKEKGDELLEKAVNMGIYNLITATKIEDIKEEARQCVIGDGMNHASSLKFIFGGDIKQVAKAKKAEVKAEREYAFVCSNVVIGVCGLQKSCGATTTALNLSHFLASLGASVAFISTDAELLTALKSYYGIDCKNDSIFSYNGVDYCLVNAEKEYNFLICIVKGVSNVKNATVPIVVASSKPYNHKVLFDNAKELKDTKYSLLLPMTPKQDQSIFGKQFDPENCNIYFPQCSEKLFESKINANIWQSILGEYIIWAKKPQNILGKER